MATQFALEEYGEPMVNDLETSREKIVYLRSDNTSGIADLVMGMDLRLREFMEVAHCATNQQIQLGIRGFATRRYTTLERLLKRKTKNGSLKSTTYGKIKVYAKRDRHLVGEAIYHGLCCTKCYISLKVCKEGIGLPEKLFRGYGRVPEFGIRYENNKLLLAEFSTKHDVHYSGKIRGKITGYADYIPKIEQDFYAGVIVIFILDVSRDEVKHLAVKYSPANYSEGWPFFFCDFATFTGVPLGKALAAPIWIWKDGGEYSLEE